MEGAPKLLDNEELANAVKERDLGTLTIWAQITEHLLTLKYTFEKCPFCQNLTFR
jgi:hypothetical protein